MLKPLPAGRYDWVDYAKGIGIILVVLGHVMVGVYNAKIKLSYSFYSHAEEFIYSFHMPLFFFLSGLFVDLRPSKPLKSFWWNKVRTIAYPYLVWSLIQGSILALASSQSNRKFTFSELPFAIAFDPLLQFWFLYALFAAHTVFVLTKQLFKNNYYHVLVVLSILMYLVHPYVEISIIHRFLRSFIYYIAGMVLAKLLLDEKKLILFKTSQILLLSLVFILFQNILLIRVNVNFALAFFMAALGIAFVLCLSVYLSERKIANFIRYLGFFSMPIYLAHVVFAVGARIFLQKVLHLDNPILHIFVGTVLGLVLPLVLYLATERVRWPYLFSLNK